MGWRIEKADDGSYTFFDSAGKVCGRYRGGDIMSIHFADILRERHQVIAENEEWANNYRMLSEECAEAKRVRDEWHKQFCLKSEEHAQTASECSRMRDMLAQHGIKYE